jgi:hypothetical protein
MTTPLCDAGMQKIKKINNKIIKRKRRRKDNPRKNLIISHVVI